MTRIYARREGDRREKLGALAVSLGVSVGVGAVTYYLARMLISRHGVEIEPPVEVEPTIEVEPTSKLGLSGGERRLSEHGDAQR